MDRLELKKGTEIRILLKSDWMTLKYKIKGTNEIINITYLDEIIQDEDMEFIDASVSNLPIDTTLIVDIPILEDYSDTDFRLLYKDKDRNLNYISSRITDVKLFQENGYVIETDDNIDYYIDILKEF